MILRYSYFWEKKYERFSEPLFEELDLNIFVDSDHRYDKVTGRSITGLLYVLVQHKQPGHQRDRNVYIHPPLKKKNQH